ncbi:DUF1127 domain-containing protein [Tabrizicola sp.]|uniref:DUF1127 domain-containing protein n=1 Tax=Tabrizicola sp. TaxID=2005166 RepID=UPI002736B335|nr:DUF1127 domain-containing protein [Tabrizicola sp.]MDP3196927.1 DUF1127 domain-containing protein [Tabrizicola sp.]
MTDITLTLRDERRFAQRLRLWLASLGRRRTPAADLDTLSDHMLRDIGIGIGIGIERDPLDRMAIRTLHDAMRYSG